MPTAPPDAAFLSGLAAALAAPPSAAALNLPGLTLGDRLGGGGFADVYVAEDRDHPAGPVAVKVFRPTARATDAAARDRFVREFDLVRRLKHDNIIRVHKFGVAGGRAWISMDAVAGRTLADRFARVNRDALGCPAAADLRELLPVIATVAAAAHAAHAEDVTHRDLTPANVMLRAADGQPVVIDFGCGRLMADAGSLLTPEPVALTPAYAAPEVKAGRGGSGVAADVYGLGGLLHELLAGRPPGGELPNGTHPDLAAICAKCLAAAPADRYATAAAVAADLARFARREPVLARPPAWRERPGYWVRRSPRRAAGMLAAGGLAVALAAAGVGWYADAARRDAADAARANAEAVAAIAADADAKSRRGEWAEAIPRYEQAIAAGHPDIPRLTVARLRARFAADQLPGLYEAAFGLAHDRTMVGVNGELLLLTADVCLTNPRLAAEGRTFAQQALAAGLPPADAAYARGLLAATPAQTLAEFRAAVALDPYHRPAHAGLLAGLTLSGATATARRADAGIQADTVRTLFPADPLVPLADGLFALVTANKKVGRAAFDTYAARLPENRREAATEAADALNAVAGMIRNHKRGTSPLNPKMTRQLEAEFGQMYLDSFRQSARQNGSTVGIPDMLIERFFRPGAAYIEAAGLLNFQNDLPAALARADAAAAETPDASLLALSAGLHWLAMTQRFLATPMDWTGVAAELEFVRDRGEAAAAADTVFPAGTFAYEGRAWAAFATALLGRPEVNRPDPPRLRRHLRAIVAEGATAPTARREVVRMLLQGGFLPPDQARTLLADWGLDDPADPEPWAELAKLETSLGNTAAAKAAADRAAAVRQ